MMKVSHFTSSSSIFRRSFSPFSNSSYSNGFTKSCGMSTDVKGSFLQLEKRDKGIVVASMSRKPVNSLSLEFLKEIRTALNDLERDDSVRGLILSSSLPKIFSAGLDINEFCNPSKERFYEFWSSLQDVWMKLFGSRLATIAAITGEAPAGGCLLSLCCDYRVMNKNHRIGLNEVQLGIVAPSWFTDSMTHVVGSRQAERLIQLGTMVPAPEAQSIGLVDSIHDTPEEVMQSAHETLSKFLKISDSARYQSKIQFREPIIKRLESKKEQDIHSAYEFLSSSPVQKALNAYLQALGSKGK